MATSTSTYWNAGWFVLTILSLSGCGDMGSKAQPGQEIIAENENQVTNELLQSIKQISRDRSNDGSSMKRFNQPKSLGCFNAEFRINQNLPAELRQGLFASSGSFPARIRFANATKFDDRVKDFRGFSIKVGNVPGRPLWGKPGDQDFILNSYPALFARNVDDFLGFTKAMEKGRVWSFFANPLHWKSLWIAVRGRDKTSSPFETQFWSTTPYRFGLDQSVAVKYSVKPCNSVPVAENLADHKDRLREAMRLHLNEGPACFDFMVQLQSDPDTMPIEDASVIWDESESPFRNVARITIANQNFESAEAMGLCEGISFNPWQSLSEHKPIGGINRVRKLIYAEMAKFREAT